MRYYKSIFDKIALGVERGFVGSLKPNGRVTVEPLWELNETAPVYGDSVRGPYRWFQDTDDSGVQWEVPNIKEIEIDRDDTQDIATCNITLYNMWHEGNFENQELVGQLGKPGFFWPKRGLSVNRWGQIEGRGAFRKDGFWDPNFSWANTLMPYVKLRTYEGYGGHPTADEFKSIDDNLNDENVLLTGTWMIDRIEAGSSGEMRLVCKDMGKLLLEEICFPPVVPGELYPLEYQPAGKSAFDAYFGPKPSNGVSPGSKGKVVVSAGASSGDSDATVNTDHPTSAALDSSWNTFALSEAYRTADPDRVNFRFEVGQGISSLAIKAWAGGYNCYIAISEASVLQGSEMVPGSSTPYVKKINIPLAAPDNREPVINIELDREYLADFVVIYFDHLHYSSIPDASGYRYRGGIRDITFYREGAKVDPYTPDFSTVPWTFSMTSHPTRGYWVIDSSGNVYGFGDAADYVGPQLDLTAVHADNQAIAMTAHPDGKGYWAIDRVGTVYAYGSASHHGEHIVAWPGTDKWGEDGLAAWDITPTYTGDGYWVCYGDGKIYGFGDADPSYVELPDTLVQTFMDTFINPRWHYQHKANGICGHPTKMGFWVTSGDGEVWAYGAAEHYGQLNERVYNAGMADTFRLTKTEYTKCIECTETGNGYWIAFGSGHIAAFGDAVNKGPSYVYKDNPMIDIPFDESTVTDFSFYRALVWDLARDPDGSGFWVLVADGHVKGYEAEFWGNPAYHGLSGYRWHEGNFSGDHQEIIKELCLWAGFTFYDPDETGTPQLFGSVESTGIKTDVGLTADKFDKRPLLDIIKELCEVVAYKFSIREDGGIKIASPNIWRAGNFDLDGFYIWVDEDGNRVEDSDPGAEIFIPVVDERVDMFNYSASITSDSMRSEIIIGTDVPDPKDPSVTGYVRHIPRSATEEVKPGIKMMRNIPRVAMWISQLFQNREEAQLMAELISLNAWFAERSGSVSCIANPCISVGDQIKIYERNTSESYIHYVSGIHSSNNLDSGVWTYDFTTHWLGDEDNWVITSDNADQPVIGSRYIQVSELVDRWQSGTNRGLERGDGAQGDYSGLIMMTGTFDRGSLPLTGDDSDDEWVFSGQLVLNKRYTDLNVYLHTLAPPLGSQVFFDAYKDEVLVVSVELDGTQVGTVLPAIGFDGAETTYDIKLRGYPTAVGNGLLKVQMRVDGEVSASATDTLLITR